MKLVKKVIAIFLLMFLFNINIVKAETKNIDVENVKVKDNSGTITVADPVLSSNEIVSNVTFNQKDDFVTFELTIKNNEEDKYKITSIKDNNTNENVIVEYNYDESYISKGETTTVTIKLKYNKQLLNIEKVNLKDLSIILSFENEDGNNSQLIINPVTRDNILHYLVLLIIAVTGLIIIKVRKNKIIGRLLLVLPIFLISFITFAKEKYEINFKFTDIVVKGEFEVYNISIDKGDGSVPEIRQITYGNSIGQLANNPSKEGYTFDRWEDSDGNEVTEDTVITKPTNIIAKYNAIEYTITYDLGGGSLINNNPSTYTIESNDILLNNPSKEGYTFTGWTGTGLDNKTTSVTIENGSTGNRSYEATYSSNENTPYTVIHRYQNLDGTYIEETVTEYGETDKEVVAPTKSKTGFVTPTSQNVTVKEDGSAVVTYTYDRETYAFSITDRTYIDSISTSDGTYPYETSITLKAQAREGYTFSWSDGETDFERTIILTETTTLTPVYTANTNTPYVVKHYKQKITLDGYELADTQNLEGTTDTPITPAVNTYTGFTSPSTQTTTIKGDGSTVVAYTYDREEYTVTFNTNGGTEIQPQTIHYGQKITRPTEDPTKENATFYDWYTTNGYTKLFDFANTVITDNITIYAKFKKDLFPVVFSETGECTFNGSSGVITGNNCEYADGVNKYIDTGINLYNTTNHDKDYEIGFTIVHYDYTEQEESQSTIMNTKLEGNNYPGLVFRKSNVTNSDYDLSSRISISDNTRIYFDPNNVETVKIYRIYNEDEDTQEIFYSINGEEKIKLNDLSQYNPIFNLSVWFGAAPSNAEATGARRYFTGTLSNMYVKVGAYNQEDKYDVSFDTDGGTSIDSQIVNSGGVATRPAYIPYKEGYGFVDWYADSELTTLYDFSKPVNNDTVIYAKYVENQFPLVFNHEGECIFNGSGGVLEGNDCAFADGFNKFIDTRVQLYNAANHDKDYEIGFTIVSYNPSGQENQATFMNTKSEGTGYPGVIFRKKSNSQDYDLSSRRTSSANSVANFEYGTVNKVKIYRIYNDETEKQEIYYSINDGEKTKINDLSSFNPIFDLNAWFGAAPTNESATTAQRYLVGTLKEMYIRLGTYSEESDKYTIIYNANGGSVSPTSKKIYIGEEIGALPTPTAPAGKTFIGWYTGISDGVEVTNSYIPEGNRTIYARYYQDITGATFSPSNITMLNGGNQTITVSNVEEEYTFTSNDTSVATVDSTGKVTGTGIGTTTITVTGVSSGKTKTIDVTVESTTYTVTLNSNGGTVDPTSITKDKGVSIGELPTPTVPVGKTFSGWYTGISDGVEVTSSYMPNSNVTIYARYVDITFTVSFDTDGGSGVASQTIIYGNKVTRPTTDPTKTGMTFDNWYTDSSYNTLFDFNNTTITEDKTIYAKFIDPCNGFSTDSWSTIKSNIVSDSNYYGVGCEKKVELDMDDDGTDESYTVRLANTSTPSACYTDGYSQTACGTVIEFVTALTPHRMNPSYDDLNNEIGNKGGWRDSEMRSYINTNIYDKLPDELKNIIINTSVNSGHGVSDDYNFETIDKLYLLTTSEIAQKTAGDTSETRTLDYYQNLSYSDAIKKNINGSAVVWWLRSVPKTVKTSFDRVYTLGGSGYESSSYDNWVIPVFRINEAQRPAIIVSFNVDGGSLVESQIFTNRGKATRPATNPTKYGYLFDNWYTDDTYTTLFDFDNTEITSDTTIYAHFVDKYQCKTFSTDSWSTIKDNIESDSNYYDVGCEKEVELDMDDDGTNESYTVRLANTSTPEVCSTEGYSQTACGTVIEFADIVTRAKMNYNNTSAGGWKSTVMVSYLNSTFYNKLPSDLQNIIVPTYPIVSGSGKRSNSPNITETDINKNKIYLLSSTEAGNYTSIDNKDNTRKLDYYILNNDYRSRIKKDLRGIAQDWWLRSADFTSSDHFLYISSNSNVNSNSSDFSKGVAPVFRIGIN